VTDKQSMSAAVRLRPILAHLVQRYRADQGPSYNSSEFRHANDEVSATYAEYRSIDAHRNRTTSIIGGFWQESGGSSSPAEEDTSTECRNAFYYVVKCASM
jgi:hypothetical protein